MVTLKSKPPFIPTVTADSAGAAQNSAAAGQEYNEYASNDYYSVRYKSGKTNPGFPILPIRASDAKTEALAANKPTPRAVTIPPFLETMTQAVPEKTLAPIHIFYDGQALPKRSKDLEYHYLQFMAVVAVILVIISIALLGKLPSRSKVFNPAPAGQESMGAAQLAPETKISAAPLAVDVPPFELSSDAKATRESLFASLPISAVVSAGVPRVLIGSRVVRIGEPLIADIILVTVTATNIVGRDDAGIIYSRELP